MCSRDALTPNKLYEERKKEEKGASKKGVLVLCALALARESSSFVDDGLEVLS